MIKNAKQAYKLAWQMWRVYDNASDFQSSVDYAAEYTDYESYTLEELWFDHAEIKTKLSEYIGWEFISQMARQSQLTRMRMQRWTIYEHCPASQHLTSVRYYMNNSENWMNIMYRECAALNHLVTTDSY